MSNNSNNMYNKGEGGSNNSTYSEGGDSNTYSEGRGGNNNTSCKGWNCRKEMKGEATKVEIECWPPWIA